MLSQLKFSTDQVCLTDDAIKFLIDEYSKTESGVRNLIRAVESMMTRLNMLRVSQHESMKEYPFYMEVTLPLQITKKVVQTLMKDGAKIKQEETWRTMYT
jgi:ATP-dependent Lon protease